MSQYDGKEYGFLMRTTDGNIHKFKSFDCAEENSIKTNPYNFLKKSQTINLNEIVVIRREHKPSTFIVSTLETTLFILIVGSWLDFWYNGFGGS